MNDKKPTSLSPVLFIPHGGGPLPLLGDPAHESLIIFLKKIASQLGKPSAILLISAHWEEAIPTLTGGLHPEIIYDYYGFPAETYEIKYPAPGDPELAQKVVDLLAESGTQARIDNSRGYDHGLFVPLTLMYPDAEIPCVQLSMCDDLKPETHIAMGKALAALRQDNVLIVGSGLSFHNMNLFFSPSQESRNKSIEFDNWLLDTCSSSSYSTAERERRLVEWKNAPSASFCHPREEHLLPLHVCFGLATQQSPIADVVFNEDVLGHRVTGFLWS
jgi:aromatic ring-opening dioxygenase catalytic subunit (LigB family)